MGGDSGRLEATYREAAIICGAAAASTVLYALVVALIASLHAPFEGFAPGSEPSILRSALWSLALIEAGVIGLVRRAFLARARSGSIVAQARKLRAASVVTAAFAEVPAIVGLALFMLWGLRADFYALFTLSLLLQAVYFPRLDGWRAWAAEPAARC